jgi:hypothetical protein
MDVAYQALAGARGAFSHSGGGGGGDAGSARNGLDAMYSMVADAFLRWGHLVGHVGLDASLGGGGAGLEGGLGGTLMGGYRFDLGHPVGEGSARRDSGTGILVRLGGDGRFAGNDRWYDSRLIVPELEIGAQVLRSPDVLDAGAYVGPVVTGRARIDGDDRRTDGGLAYGARLSVRQGLGFAQIDVGWTTPTHGFHDQALSVRARACVALDPLSFCLDGRVLQADELRATIRSAAAEELGVSAGVGF